MRHTDDETPAEAVYTPKEVAAMLRVSTRTIYRQIDAGNIRAVQLGKTLRVPRREIDRLMGGEAA